MISNSQKKLVAIVGSLFFSNSLFMAPFVQAQGTAKVINWPAYQDQAVDLMRQYLRINTSNPPGNEIEAAKFFKAIFDKEGIQSEIFEYKPGWAPIYTTAEENAGVHGNNERITVKNVREGTREFYEVVSQIAR
ncbi:MAG: hypothetical protein H0V18_08830 [Pyrinomonadaceae bacterium]|nr:hypothetical protein [Pyrinomonadaceae bacterium]